MFLCMNTKFLCTGRPDVSADEPLIELPIDRPDYFHTDDQLEMSIQSSSHISPTSINTPHGPTHPPNPPNPPSPTTNPILWERNHRRALRCPTVRQPPTSTPNLLINCHVGLMGAITDRICFFCSPEVNFGVTGTKTK